MSDLQLQFWDPLKREYIPHHEAPVLGGGYRAWRRCKADRLRKNPKYKPPIRTSSAYSVQSIQRFYGDWARSKGLRTITAYRGRALCCGAFGGSVRYVDPDAYFAVTVETDCDLAEAA